MLSGNSVAGDGSLKAGPCRYDLAGSLVITAANGIRFAKLLSLYHHGRRPVVIFSISRIEIAGLFTQYLLWSTE
jgi:hypothetical protein